MRRKKDKFVLDSYAVLTYLKEEPGWQKVRDILWSAVTNNQTVFMSYVNLGEVYYIIYREKGGAIADKAVSLIKLWPIKFLIANENISIIAGRMKAENKISYADAYVIAAALSQQATILTGDKEFKSVEDILDIMWLPSNR